MTCTHKKSTQVWVEEQDWYTGMVVGRWEEQIESTWDDKVPGDGRFECTQCGEVRYYTGAWKKFWEEGIPCLGSKEYEHVRQQEQNERRLRCGCLPGAGEGSQTS